MASSPSGLLAVGRSRHGRLGGSGGGLVPMFWMTMPLMWPTTAMPATSRPEKRLPAQSLANQLGTTLWPTRRG